MANQIGPENEGYWSEGMWTQYDDLVAPPEYCDYCPMLEGMPFRCDDCPLNEYSTPEERREWYLEIKRFQLDVQLDACTHCDKKDCRDMNCLLGGD